MAEQIHGHMPPALDIEAVLADPAGACPDCIRIVIGQLSDALRLAESDGDSARRDLTGAYEVLTDAMPGRPATVKAAAEKAVRMIRDHDAERRRMTAERDAATDAKRRIERERDQMAKRIEQGRAAAVMYVERITEVEAERDRLADERDALAHQISAVKQVRVWKNEDGKSFVFADDLRAALDGTEGRS